MCEENDDYMDYLEYEGETYDGEDPAEVYGEYYPEEEMEGEDLDDEPKDDDQDPDQAEKNEDTAHHGLDTADIAMAGMLAAVAAKRAGMERQAAERARKRARNDTIATMVISCITFFLVILFLMICCD